MKKSVIKLVCGLIALILAVSYVDVSVFAGEIALDSSDNKTKIIRSGSIGGNIFYELDEEGFLHIWGNGSTPQYYPWALLTPTASPFIYKTGIKEVVIDEGITYLGNEFFLGCTDLVKVKLPESLIAVGIGTFYGCYNLKEVNMPLNMKNIPDQTFYECSALKKINIPHGVESIGNNVFGRCGIESIIIPSTVDSVNPDIVIDCPNIGRIINHTNTPIKCPNRNNTVTWYNVETGLTITEIANGQACSNRALYDICIKCDYWTQFTNTREFFVDGRSSDDYFMMENEYNRLVSNLSAYEKFTISKKKSKKWVGSCWGMSAWVAMQNNGWNSLNGELRTITFSDDIMSKINYYQLQPHLRNYKNNQKSFLKLENGTKLQLMKTAILSEKIPIIVFTFVDGNTGKKSCHAICGLGFREIETGETTQKGIDISNYKYCAITYDPNDKDVSLYSDHNIYFNDDGTFFIPKYNSNNLIDDKNNKICYVASSINDINYIDYFTGDRIASTTYDEKYLFMDIPLGNRYTIVWDDKSMQVDENGFIYGDIEGVDLIPVCDTTLADDSWATVALPSNHEYTIACDEGFELLAQYDGYTAYTKLSSKGSVVINDCVELNIYSAESTNNEIAIGISDEYCSIPWNYVTIKSSRGHSISLYNDSQTIVIEGDDLTDTNVEVSKENDKVYKQTLEENVTCVKISKEDENVIIEQNDKKDDDQIEQIAEEYRVSFELIERWPGGYNASIKIENISEYTKDNWKLKFAYDGEISNIWNACIVSHENDKYIIKNAGWNQDILPGQTIEIGFSGIGDFVNEPKDFALIGYLKEYDAKEFDVAFDILGDWEDGYNVNMVIKNNTDYTIEDWILEFDYLADITTIWNAEIISHEGNHYVIKNVRYNSDITPENSVTIGFISNKNSDIEYPDNFTLLSLE